MPVAEKKKTTESQFDIILLMVTLCLVAFGMLMIYSTSSYTSQVKYGDSMYFLKKQAFGVAVGVVAMFLVAKIPYTFYSMRIPGAKVRVATIIYWIAVVLQVAVLIIGTEVNGAKRWISIGPLSIQPSELSKIAVIIFTAFLIQQGLGAIGYVQGILRVMVPMFVIIGLVLVENLSTAIVITVITLGMCFIAAKKKKWYILFMLLGIAGVALVFAFGEGFRSNRVNIWQNIETNSGGYQILQGLYAIASGGVFGTGLGQSMQKLGFIPESHNDMIFSVICEELGMVGAGIVIAMFVVLLWRIFRVATTAPDLFSGLICTGVMIHIAVQVIINIAVVTNTIPSTGIPLPFISYGGTSIMILMAEMGLVLGISARRKSG